MRTKAKKDANQDEIVAALEGAGATVMSLASMGSGCPDLLVGFQDQNFLIEVKDGKKPPSHRDLTDDQIRFFLKWRGQKGIATNEDEALWIVGVIR